MALALYHKLPIDLIKHIYRFSRNKGVTDYDYQIHRQACQLFYYHQSSDQVNNHSFWTYDIWIQPNHPEVKAVELTIQYLRNGTPQVSHISLANKQCFQIGKYSVQQGWGLAFHQRVQASVKPEVPASVKPEVPASVKPEVPASVKPEVPASVKPEVPAFSVKLVKEMDVWERARWQRFLTRLETMSYLDYSLQQRRVLAPVSLTD